MWTTVFNSIGDGSSGHLGCLQLIKIKQNAPAPQINLLNIVLRLSYQAFMLKSLKMFQ